MTPHPSSRRLRRIDVVSHKHGKGPVRYRRGPKKNPCARCSAHAKPLGTPAQGGLDERAAKHCRAIENAHIDHPRLRNAEAPGAHGQTRARGSAWRQINRQDGRRLWANSQLRYDFFWAQWVRWLAPLREARPAATIKWGYGVTARSS